MENKYDIHKINGRSLSAEEYLARWNGPGKRDAAITRIIWSIIYAEAVVFQIKNYQYFQLLYHSIGRKIIEGLFFFNVSYLFTALMLCFYRFRWSREYDEAHSYHAPVRWLFFVDIMILVLHTWYYFFCFPDSVTLEMILNWIRT